jgi:hypothetical protein
MPGVPNEKEIGQTHSSKVSVERASQKFARMELATSAKSRVPVHVAVLRIAFNVLTGNQILNAIFDNLQNVTTQKPKRCMRLFAHAGQA